MIVSELRHKFPLKALLKLSGLARSTYYYHLKQQGTDKYCVVKQKIEKIFTENKQRYGYRRILLVLRRQGIKLNHKTEAWDYTVNGVKASTNRIKAKWER